MRTERACALAAARLLARALVGLVFFGQLWPTLVALWGSKKQAGSQRSGGSGSSIAT